MLNVLGDSARHLPKPLVDFHAGRDGSVFAGTVTVKQGNALARLLSRLGGFPKTMHNRPMRMWITQKSGGEEWNRNFDGHTLSSTVRQLSSTHVAERFGPFDVHMCPTVTQTGLDMPVTSMRFLGLAIPSWLFRGSGGREALSSNQQIAFHVSSYLFGIGRVIEYQGSFSPVPPRVSASPGSEPMDSVDGPF